MVPRCLIGMIEDPRTAVASRWQPVMALDGTVVVADQPRRIAQSASAASIIARKCSTGNAPATRRPLIRNDGVAEMSTAAPAA